MQSETKRLKYASGNYKIMFCEEGKCVDVKATKCNKVFEDINNQIELESLQKLSPFKITNCLTRLDFLECFLSVIRQQSALVQR